MLTRTIRIQVFVFVVLSLTAVAFVGANYAGLGRLFGSDSYTVRLQLDDGGGIFTNSEVTYRGVAVGRVGELRLTDDGMEADLVIADDAPQIPVDAKAVVANRSAIGEQYVDLQPRGESGPFLADGGVIPRSAATVPPPVTDLLGDLSAFDRSVPTGSLRRSSTSCTRRCATPDRTCRCCWTRRSRSPRPPPTTCRRRPR